MATTAISSEKAKCKFPGCGHTDHILIPHLKDAHGIETGEELYDYTVKHGGSPLLLCSSYGWEVYRNLNGRSVKSHPVPRPKKRVPIMTLIPSLRSALAEMAPDGTMKFREYSGEVEIFAEATALTPSLDPNYVFPAEVTVDLITCLSKVQRNRAYIQGLSGTGKTTLVHNLAAAFNAPLYEINGDQFLEREHLIGGWTVKDGETVFRYGLIPQAMMNGGWLQYNEWDTMSPVVANIFKPVLEDPPYLAIEETGEMIRHVPPGQPIPPNVIPLHPDFRIIATANTWGRGDDTGLFGVNTNVLSDADMRRWSFRLEVDYMPPEQEMAMLVRYFSPETPEDIKLLEGMIDVANKVREAFRQKKIDKTFSPAELINWAENVLYCSKGVLHAANVSFMNALAADVKVTISEMINGVFGHGS